MISNSRPSSLSRAFHQGSTAAIGLVALSLCGCIINTGSHSECSGKYIGQQTLDQVSAGKSKEFVVAILGEPTNKTPLSDGTEIWKWFYREKKKSSGTVLFVFNGDSTTETESATYVMFKNEVVTQSWRD